MAVTRRQFLTDLAVWSGIGLATAAYGFVVEPGFRLTTVTHRVAPPGWRAGRRLRIAMIADPHMAEPYWPISRLEHVVESANALQPDLTVLMGDYASTSHRWVTREVPMQATAETLAQLKAPLGVFAVLGNHDWWVDPEAQAAWKGPPRMQRELERVGLPVLENLAVKIGAGEEAFWLAGIGSQIAFKRHDGRGIAGGSDDLPGTLAQITDDAPAILLAHEPDIFMHMSDRIALTLCGHTHGGQIRLFGWSPFSPSRYGNRYAYGHVRENGRDMVISGGLGCSIMPVRFGVPPEITVVEVG